ncbi:MAG: metalloregulator ArsR/SmtB family transcription factor [Phycisphaerales bacterium]
MVSHTVGPDLESGPEGVFRAIADPTRRAILDGLRGGARPAGAIAGDFADRMSRPAVGKHLRVLEDAGLVAVERRGRERRYRLRAGPLAEVESWVTGYRSFWAARLVSIKDAAEREHRAGDTPDGKEGGA